MVIVDDVAHRFGVVTAVIAKWQPILGLRDWEIVFRGFADSPQGRSDSYGATQWNDGMHATIELSAEYEHADMVRRASIESSVVHELLHLVKISCGSHTSEAALDALATCGMDEEHAKVLQAWRTDSEEAFISRLERPLLAAYRAGWDAGYEEGRPKTLHEHYGEGLAPA